MKLIITASCNRFIFNPLKKMLNKLFKFRLRKPLSVVRLRRRSRNRGTTFEHWSRRGIFRSLRKAGEDEDEAMELKSFSGTTTNQKAPFSSPLTPAYVRMIAEAANDREVGRIPAEVEDDACRSFEKCLAGMIVEEEEGKMMMMRDLMDVEDLIYCWENLKCPVFLDLVCRFYRDLCKDVFSDNNTLDPDTIRSIFNS